MSTQIEERERRISLVGEHRRKLKKNSFNKVFVRPVVPSEEQEIQSFPKSDDQANLLKETISNHFMFTDASETEVSRMVDAMKFQKAAQDEIIINEGETLDDSQVYFYVLEEGAVAFFVGGEEVFRSDERGSSFGELEIIYPQPRAATCKALIESLLWKVDAPTLRYLLARCSHEHTQGIREHLSQIALFDGWDEAKLEQLADAATTVKFKKNDKVIHKGDSGEILYIIQEGEAKVHDIGIGDSPFSDLTLREGDWFGDMEIMNEKTRKANVTAISDFLMTYALSIKDVENSLGPLKAVMEREQNYKVLRAMPIFCNSDLNNVEIRLLVDRMTVRSHEKGDVIAKAGKTRERCLWVVKQGLVKLQSTEDKESHLLKPGDYFGDKWVKESSDYVGTTTVICEEDSQFLVLTREDIENVIDSIERVGSHLPYRRPLQLEGVELEDIQKHKILGRGEFAVVWLVSNKKSGETYALKELDKLHLVEHTIDAVAATMHEKEIMCMLHHPLIMGMHAAFQDNKSIYLLLPLFQGGELWNRIYEDDDNWGLPEDQARFYGACVLEAFSYMHERHICYRDLKPDNVLIDRQGYGVVIDMGLAKVVIQKTYTMCGNPEYMSPEVIMCRGHSKACDYWAFGVLLYHMIKGETPFFFEGATQSEGLEMVVKADYHMDDTFGDDVKNLISRLLVLDPTKRLGSGPKGHGEVMEHPWFNTIQFKKIRKKQYDAPWVPEIKDGFDSSNFDEYDPEEEVFRPYRALTQKEQAKFIGFA